jgi:hypothetical protein
MLTIELKSGAPLRRVLLADGLTSGITGLGLVLLPGPIAALIGAPAASLVAGIGLGLILFGLTLVSMSRRPVPSRGGTIFAAGANLAWVVGSVVIVLVGGLNAVGRLGLILVGLVVLAFAILELRHLPDPLDGMATTLDRAGA